MNRARTRPCLRSFEGFDSFCHWEVCTRYRGFLENYKENEAWAEHPVLFEGIQNYSKDISDKGGRHFLVSHRNDQVLELLAKTQIANYFRGGDCQFWLLNGNQILSPWFIYVINIILHLVWSLVTEILMEAGKAAGLDAYLLITLRHWDKQ